MTRLGIHPLPREALCVQGWAEKRGAEIHAAVRAARASAVEAEATRIEEYLASQPNCPACGVKLKELPCERCARLRRAAFTMSPGGVYQVGDSMEVVEVPDGEAQECEYTGEIILVEDQVCAKFRHPDTQITYAQPIDPESV